MAANTAKLPERVSSLWVQQYSFKAGETLFGQDPKNSNELLITRSENSYQNLAEQART
jgi:hypothetical protein